MVKPYLESRTTSLGGSITHSSKHDGQPGRLLLEAYCPENDFLISVILFRL
jgi:hypothetical protein